MGCRLDVFLVRSRIGVCFRAERVDKSAFGQAFARSEPMGRRI